MLTAKRFQINRKLWSFGEYYDIYGDGGRKVMICKRSMVKNELYFYDGRYAEPPLMIVKQTTLKRNLLTWTVLYTAYNQGSSPIFFIECRSKVNWRAFVDGGRPETCVRAYTLLNQYKQTIGTIEPDDPSAIYYFKFRVNSTTIAKFYKITYLLYKYVLELEDKNEQLLDVRLIIVASVILSLNAANLNKCDAKVFEEEKYLEIY